MDSLMEFLVIFIYGLALTLNMSCDKLIELMLKAGNGIS